MGSDVDRRVCIVVVVVVQHAVRWSGRGDCRLRPGELHWEVAVHLQSGVHSGKVIVIVCRYLHRLAARRQHCIDFTSMYCAFFGCFLCSIVTFNKNIFRFTVIFICVCNTELECINSVFPSLCHKMLFFRLRLALRLSSLSLTFAYSKM